MLACVDAASCVEGSLLCACTTWQSLCARCWLPSSGVCSWGRASAVLLLVLLCTLLCCTRPCWCFSVLCSAVQGPASASLCSALYNAPLYALAVRSLSFSVRCAPASVSQGLAYRTQCV
ncbi:hypothetical protein DUNSADRAFT_11729 [Dunaliella salina]|uniref:Uncharacterized protein n=1 Tax=Dunaliella salina TaxID=3046 RepID=A0ABQ7GCQ8_DUNSA|nr:hypothetical protein DUNSADRAFT_11729 [Dunaliella salina]|eukprot:KAF5832397.1 hypothetical protein DUNSADRAFT_11729 [Dunaliella salina]